MGWTLNVHKSKFIKTFISLKLTKHNLEISSKGWYCGAGSISDPGSQTGSGLGSGLGSGSGSELLSESISLSDWSDSPSVCG